VLGVNASHPFNSWGDKPPVAGTAEGIARALPGTVNLSAEDREGWAAGGPTRQPRRR
jgi:hypothetical protein